jgi:hypothetical protein
MIRLVVSGAQAQSHEAQQLLLNVTKLTQFRQILDDMKKGYEILVKGYNTIKDISEGNFNLHDAFLDALYAVSPTVRKYRKIAGIIDLQVKIVERYKKAFKRFRDSGQFSIDEVGYLSRVYGRLTSASLKNLEDLGMVITAGQTRMSDAERLSAIDRIYQESEDQYAFLNDFNGKTSVLMVQRVKESGDVRVMRELYK